MIHLSCPSIPERADSLRDWLAWAVTQPVDTINIYLDRYPAVPEWLANNTDPRVRFRACAPAGADPRLAVVGKFAWAEESGIHVTTDDDLRYPADYVARITRQLEEVEAMVEGPAVVTYHGSVFNDSYDFHYSGRSRRSLSRNKRNRTQRVHQAGTGVMAFRSPDVDLRPARFERTIGIDSLVAVMMRDDGVPIYVLEAPPAYWKPNKRAIGTPAICASSMARDGSELDVGAAQTETIRAAAPWPSLSHITSSTMAKTSGSADVVMLVSTNSAYGFLHKDETHRVDARTAERWTRYKIARPAEGETKRSKDMSAKEAIKHIENAKKGNLAAFVEGDDRKTVLAAYEARA